MRVSTESEELAREYLARLDAFGQDLRARGFRTAAATRRTVVDSLGSPGTGTRVRYHGTLTSLTNVQVLISRNQGLGESRLHEIEIRIDATKPSRDEGEAAWSALQDSITKLITEEG